jgi:hypothetical protein
MSVIVIGLPGLAPHIARYTSTEVPEGADTVSQMRAAQPELQKAHKGEPSNVDAVLLPYAPLSHNGWLNWVRMVNSIVSVKVVVLAPTVDDALAAQKLGLTAWVFTDGADLASVGALLGVELPAYPITLSNGEFGVTAPGQAISTGGNGSDADEFDDDIFGDQTWLDDGSEDEEPEDDSDDEIYPEVEVLAPIFAPAPVVVATPALVPAPPAVSLEDSFPEPTRVSGFSFAPPTAAQALPPPVLVAAPVVVPAPAPRVAPPVSPAVSLEDSFPEPTRVKTADVVPVRDDRLKEPAGWAPTSLMTPRDQSAGKACKILFTCEKGGAGKTFSALQSAQFCAEHGLKTLVLEMSLQNDFALKLSFPAGSPTYDMFDGDVSKVVANAKHWKPDFLLCPQGSIRNADALWETLLAVIRAADDVYDVIICDADKADLRHLPHTPVAEKALRLAAAGEAHILLAVGAGLDVSLKQCGDSAQILKLMYPKARISGLITNVNSKEKGTASLVPKAQSDMRKAIFVPETLIRTDKEVSNKYAVGYPSTKKGSELNEALRECMYHLTERACFSPAQTGKAAVSKKKLWNR